MPQVAYRAVRSRQKFSKAPEIVRQLGAVMDSVVKPHFIKEFDKRIANWEHKVEFQARKFISANAISLNVYPTGKNAKLWEYNVKGTRPHTIRAKRAKTLAFLWGGPGSYQPKTTTSGGYGGPGSVIGGAKVFPVEVHHPGTAPRPHVKVIKEENKKWYADTMENAWRRILRTV